MSMTLTTNPTRRAAGIAAVLIGLLLAVLPQTAALAVDAELGSPGNPSDECAGLEYLDKFDLTTFRFDVGDTTGPTVNPDGSVTYASSTGVTVTFELDGGETHLISWTSTTPVDRVWLKAGRDTDAGSAYDEATAGSESVVGNGFSHITFCYDEDQPEDPTVSLTPECVEGTSTITVLIEDPDETGAEFDVLVDNVLVATVGAGTYEYTGAAGEVLAVYEAGGSKLVDSDVFLDCFEPQDPSWEVTGECLDATVTITNPDEVEFSLDVSINGQFVETITETTEYELEDGDVLEVTDGETTEEFTGDDCVEPREATWEVTGECLDATVTITNPDEVEFSLDVSINGQFVETITETTEYELEDGDVLEVTDGETTEEFTGDDCLDDADVVLSAECPEDEPTITVTVTQVQASEFVAAAVKPVHVYINGAFVESITSTTAYDGVQGQLLEVRDDEGNVLASAEFPECATPQTPQVAAETQCDGTTPVATVLVLTTTNGGVIPVDVYIDGAYVESITTTTTYTGAAGQQLEVFDAEGALLADATFEDCVEPVPSTVVFSTGVECNENAPAVLYEVEFAQGDDPIASATLTFSDADGNVLETVTLTEDGAGSLLMPGRDGELVTVTLDHDGSSETVTLLDDCEEVLGETETRDPAPEPEVEGETLPNAGATSSGILLLALGLVLMGLGLLVVDNRQRGFSPAI